MEEIRLTAELKKNCETNRKKLSKLMKVYDLCVLGYDIQEQRCKDVYNKVLSENEFYVSRDMKRAEIKVGERITDEKFDFLLSDEDFDRLQTLFRNIREVTPEHEPQRNTCGSTIINQQTKNYERIRLQRFY